MAYKVYKELERILKIKDIPLNVDKVLDIAKNISTIKVKLPKNDQVRTKTMLITPSTSQSRLSYIFILLMYLTEDETG